MSKTRSTIQRQQDLARLSEMRLACRPVSEIAKEIGVSVRSIYYDIEKLNAFWKKERIGEVGAVKARQEAELLFMRREIFKDFRAERISAKEKNDLLFGVWDRMCRLYGVHDANDGPPPNITVQFTTRRKESKAAPVPKPRALQSGT